MSNHCFSFLEDSYPEICNEAKYCEKHLVEGNYTDSIMRAGKAAEFITRYICEFNHQYSIVSSSQKDKLEILGYKGIINDDIYKRLNRGSLGAMERKRLVGF